MKYKAIDLTRALVALAVGAKDKKHFSSSVEKFFSYIKDIKANALIPKILGMFPAEWNKAHKTPQIRGVFIAIIKLIIVCFIKHPYVIQNQSLSISKE